jgi:hypothetical protein
MPVRIYQSIRRHISEDNNLHTLYHKNLKSCSQIWIKEVLMYQDEESNSK